MRILIVEDDRMQAEAVMRALAPYRHSVAIADDGEQALRHLKSAPVDATILDWHLPKMSGLEVLHWIRAHLGAEHGVLFLTSRVLEIDIVSALQAGADDYVVKPFRTVELAARVNALLRRARRDPEQDAPIAAGDYLLDPVSRSVALRGEAIDLTAKEYQLIAVLLANLGKIVSRELLAITAWGRELEVASRSLDTHIYRLRQKLRLKPENGLRLSSVYTAGYRLDVVGAPPEGHAVQATVMGFARG